MSDWIILTTLKTGKPVDIRASTILAFEALDKNPGSFVYIATQIRPAQVRETPEELRQLLQIRN